MARRNTRELILSTSLALLNELGEPNVTTNHIADEAEISPGNLYYHFRSKSSIILELFKRFAAQFEPLLDVPGDLRISSEDLWFQLHLSFELKGNYRFLYRNLADITAEAPDLKRAFRGLLLRERRAALQMIDSLEQQGALNIGSEEKRLLLNNLMLALVYWIPFADLFEEEGLANSDVQVRAIAGVLHMIQPYLHQAERAEFARMAATYLSHSK